jgi:peptide/nickel transport system substrate-binding protein
MTETKWKPASFLTLGLLIGACLCTPVLRAAELRLGLGTEITTLDPHFQNLGPSVNTSMHLFDALINNDRDKGQLKPGLAESWKAIDELTWEFKLRKGVKFHDGSDFSAEDVIASFDRPGALSGSAAPFSMYTREITEKIVVDKYTVRFKTAHPYATLPVDVSGIYIVPKKVATMSTDDFNSGRAAIGTGPYKFVRWTRGDRIELARNEQYWGGKPQWDKVSLHMIVTPAARVAALLAGDVDAIESVPPADYSKLKSNKNVNLFSTVSSRLVFLECDASRDVSPYVSDKHGKPLASNPLKDPRVRRALSMAINRPAIADRVMEGLAIPAGQLVPAGSYGWTDNLKVEKFDPEGAKKLLAAAGYADGFSLTLHGPAGRYVNDEKILQTIAQMFARIGIRSKVESFPVAVYWGRLAKQDSSVMMYGWGGGTGHVSSFLKSLLTTNDPAKGYGSGNYGRYSNSQVDALTTQAYTTIDPAKQEKLWQQATEIALGEQGLIPLHHQMNVWATRKNLRYYPRTDERTLAWEFTPVP